MFVEFPMRYKRKILLHFETKTFALKKNVAVGHKRKRPLFNCCCNSYPLGVLCNNERWLFGEKRALFSKKKSQIRKKNHLAFYILSKIEIVVKKGVVIFWPLAVLFFLEAVYTLLHLSGLDNKHPGNTFLLNLTYSRTFSFTKNPQQSRKD